MTIPSDAAPTRLGEWRALDAAGRDRWLREASARWFRQAHAGELARFVETDAIAVDLDGDVIRLVCDHEALPGGGWWPRVGAPA